MPDQNAPQTRRERRWSEAAKADRARRQVRTTNGRQPASSSKRPIVIQIGGAKPKRRRRPRVRSKKHGVIASIMLIVTSVFTLTWLTLGGTLWCVATLTAGLATVAECVLMFDPESVVPAPKPRRAKPASPRGNDGSTQRGSSSGTGPRKKTPSKPKKRVCSARCQTSTKPSSTCNCVCQGKTHGVRKLNAVS